MEVIAETHGTILLRRERSSRKEGFNTFVHMALMRRTNRHLPMLHRLAVLAGFEPATL